MSIEILRRLVNNLDLYEDVLGFKFADIETYPHEELVLNHLYATIAEARDTIAKHDKGKTNVSSV